MPKPKKEQTKGKRSCPYTAVNFKQVAKATAILQNRSYETNYLQGEQQWLSMMLN